MQTTRLYKMITEDAGPHADISREVWRRGSATIFGWTWFGFDTEETMRRFLEHWPQPEPPR